jgi:DNA-binding NarL/FixJ family response regulator
MIRVLLVDDQELVRTGLRGILRTQFGFEIAGELANGSRVAETVDELHPDVVLMDVRMPSVDGVQATSELRRRAASPPVLALTTFDDDEVLAAMLRAGASGFILKGVTAEDLQRAVRVVAEGGAWLDPAVTGRVLKVYRSATPKASAGDVGLDLLSGREREVLALIGQGKTNAEIAAELFLGEGTVKTHINRLFAKLHLRDRAAAIVYAFDHDLVTPRSERLPREPPHGRPAVGWASLGGAGCRDRCFEERAVVVGAVVPTRGHAARDHKVSEASFCVHVRAKGEVGEGAFGDLPPALRDDV